MGITEYLRMAMPRFAVVARVLTLLLAAACIPAPAAGLPRAAPESQGVASADLLAFVAALDAAGDAAQADGIHSLMVVRHGHVVAEGWWAPYTPERRHQLYSLSKSFTSTAVGIAAAEGRLRVDDPVLPFFPDEAPAAPAAHLKAMRVADLLRMATGHQTEPPRATGESWVKQFLAHPVPFKPGTHFLYSTAATYMQSAIVQKASGEKLLDYLALRLFGPLGIEGATWEESPEGISTGGYGLSIRTEDIATFGQLLLQRGTWEGQQLVPAEWIDAATSRQVANGSNPASDWDQGYGYQFWRCRHGAYRGDGAFGQFCLVLPEQDAVVAITSGTREMQRVLDLAWKHLLPAFRSVPLAADEAAHARLRDRLAALHVPLPAAAPVPADLVGRRFRFDDNPAGLATLLVEPGAEGAPPTIVVAAGGTERRIPCGQGRWLSGDAASPGAVVPGLSWPGMPTGPAAVAAGFDDAAAVLRLCFVETPFVATLRLVPAGEGVTFGGRMNVAFGQTALPPITGKRVAAE